MADPFVIRSVTVALNSSYFDDTPGPDRLSLTSFVATLIASGANRVVLSDALGFMDTADANVISDRPAWSASYEQISSLIQTLHGAGLEVGFWPFLNGNYGGIVGATPLTRPAPADAAIWFQSFKARVLTAARFAEANQVEVFTVLSDETAHIFLEHRELFPKLVALVDEIRTVFSGHLSTVLWTPGSDFSQVGAFELDFLKKLDSVGIGFFPYFTLKTDPTLSEIIDSYFDNPHAGIGGRQANLVEYLAKLHTTTGKDIYIADRAFESFDGSNMDESVVFRTPLADLTVDFQEQSDLFEAFFAVLTAQKWSWLKGVSFNSYTNAPLALIDNHLSIAGETINGKPAESILQSWYKGAHPLGVAIHDLTNGAGSAYDGSVIDDHFMLAAKGVQVNGKGGIDTAVYAGKLADYVVGRAGSGHTVAALGGTDTLINVERIKFADADVAIDIEGNGGQAYRLYQAAFNRTPDAGGLGYWIRALDGGASLRDVALGFCGSAEFRDVYGANPSNAQLVTKYYENVLHRAPEAGGYNYWVGVLDQELDTAAGVLASISESAENQAGVVGVIGNGFAYTPYG